MAHKTYKIYVLRMPGCKRLGFEVLGHMYFYVDSEIFVI